MNVMTNTYTPKHKFLEVRNPASYSQLDTVI